MKRKKYVLELLVLLSVPLFSVQASGHEVDMTGDVLPPADLGSVKTNAVGDGSSANPFVYQFATATGLDMGAHKIYGNALQNKNVRLALNGGDIVAATNTSGQCTNVAFDLKANSVSTEYASGVSIANVNNIRIGKAWTWQGSLNGVGGSHNGGSVMIGTNASPGRAGKVEISEILTYACNWFTGASSGNVSIYGSGDVLIWDGVNPGDINAYHPGGNADGGSAGAVTIRHDGALRARDVLAHHDGDGSPSPILLNGNVLGDAISGSFAANSLKSYSSNIGTPGASVTVQGYTDIAITDGIYTYNASGNQFSAGGGAITVNNVTGNITIGTGGLHTYSNGGGNSGPGGNITIATTGGAIAIAGPIRTYVGGNVAGTVTLSSWGDLTLGGALNLNGGTDAQDGNLSLTSSGGTITLPSLDLRSVGWARLDFGARCSVTGAVSNFATNYTGGAGMPLNPYVTTQTELRTPAGKKIIYYPGVSGNEYLGGGSYRVADLSGGAGLGGILTPYQPPGLVVFFK